MSDKLTQEMYGLGLTPGITRSGSINPFVGSGLDRGQGRLDLGHPPIINDCASHHFSSWQREVYNLLKNTNKDIFVSSPPSSGKTSPLMCGFKHRFLEALEKRLSPGGANVKIPRILYVCPTKQLALQVSKQDFLRDPNSGVLSMVAANPKLFQQFLPPSVQLSSGRVTERIDTRTGKVIYILPSGDSVPEINGVPIFDKNGIPTIDRSTGVPFINPSTNLPFTKADIENNYLKQAKNFHLNRLDQAQINEIYKFIGEEMIGTLVGGTGIQPAFASNNLFRPLKPIIVTTYEPGRNIISRYSEFFDLVVIDESQEFVGRDGNKLDDDIATKQKAFVDIVKHTKKTASLVIMSGSTNDQSIDQVIEMLDGTFGRNFEKIPKKLGLDSETRNRSSISIFPYDQMQTPDDLKTLIKRIINTRQSNSLLIIFSIKRTAKTGIFRLIEDLIPILPVIHKEYLKSGTPLVQTTNIDTMSDKVKELREDILKLKAGGKETDAAIKEKELENEIMRIRYGMTVAEINLQILELEKELRTSDNIRNSNRIIGDIKKLKEMKPHGLWSSDSTSNLTAAELAKRDSGDFISPYANPTESGDDATSDDIEFLKKFDIRSIESKGDESSKGQVLEFPDENNLLYQAALRGIGVMIGAMHSRHKETIQKLFRNGKIHLLLGTNALGIGANAKVRHLYIPSLNKFEGGSFEPLDMSSLIQLVHRAGRGAFPTANIYCASTDVDRIQIAIKEDPRISVGQVGDVPMGNLRDYIKSKGEFAGLSMLYKLISS